MSKKAFRIITLFSIILLLSCTGRQFFYRPNQTIREISLENAIVTKSFISEKNRISLTKIVPSNNQDNGINILVIPPNGGNSTILAKLVQPLVNSGFIIYLFDYEGYGESEGKANNKNVLKDAQLVLNYVLSDKKNDTKLLLWGFSLGGNLSVKLTLDNQTKIDALVIEGAFTSHRDIAKVALPKGLKWISTIIRSPYPSKELIKSINVPVLITHSLNDDICPFTMGETLYKNANQPKYFLQLSGDHGYGLLQETDLYLDNLQLFLNQNYIK